MGFKISIDHKKLIDSPFDESNESFFDFVSSDTDDFVQEIISGNPSCYLISGYRGAGKSSFIKKLALLIQKKDDKVLFTHLNFAKHEPRSIVLRKLIRNFYLSFEKEKLFDKLKDQISRETLNQLRELYERTFYNVSKNTNQKKIDTTVSQFSFKVNLKDIIFFLAAIFLSASLLFSFDLRWYFKLLSPIPMLGLWKYFQYEIKKSNEESNSSEISKDMLYDDEIAEHYFIEILKSLKDHVKPVFVLDELDKINNDTLVENLMNELKPIMLSGFSNFIVVAGQNLYYNYYYSQTKDDGVLSSLFSKVHHVPLFSVSELSLLFKKFVDETTLSALSNEQNILLNNYIDYLIFQSKRIPRRFIVLIRQNIIWENDKAYLLIEKTVDELSIYSKILRKIEDIDSKEIASQEYPPAIRDYFNMQLLLQANKILNNQDLVFTESEMLK